MKIDFQGHVWDISERGITNKQADKIRAHTGKSIQAWFLSLGDSDAHAWESSFDALYWLMLQQNPETAAEAGLACAHIEDVDYPVYLFIEAYGTAMAAEAAAQKAAEPDPTRPAAGSARSPAPASRKSTQRTGGPRDG